MDIEIKTSDELESLEFLEQIEKINNLEGTDPSIFCKLIIAFFGIGHFHEEYAIGLLKYDSHAVNESIKDEDRMEFSKKCVCLEMTCKTVFKIQEKSDPTKHATLNMVIIRVYTQIINLAVASRSLHKVRELRELTPIEQRKLEDVSEKLKDALATRNHVIQSLKDFATKNRIELSSNIPDESFVDMIMQGQALLKKLCQWKPVYETEDLD